MSENKRYYWMKLKENFFSQRDIKVIRKQDNGAEYIIFWQQLLLLSITSNDIGVLRYKEDIAFTPDLLATVTDTNIDIVKGALTLFSKLGMIHQSDNGDILIDTLIQELIGSETSVAERVRKHRENKKKKMLPCNKVKQISNTEKEKEKEKESIYDKNNPLSLATIYLYDQIMKHINPPTYQNKKPNLDTWYIDIDRLHRIDGVSIDNIRKVIDYAVVDNFWKSNILSASKLRKHFDRLYIAMQSNTQGQPEKKIYGAM